jgi:signal transduction histidine kinase
VRACRDATCVVEAVAAHELRTRLTLDRVLLEVALADAGANAQSLRATCETLRASNQAHERLLAGLLTLACSERGLEHCEPIDLATLTAQAVLTPRPEIERRSLQLATALAPSPTTGDPALLERLIANLIDNATHYNHAGGSVEIHTATEAGQALLSVTNTGRCSAPTKSSDSSNRSNAASGAGPLQPMLTTDSASRSSARSRPPTTPL